METLYIQLDHVLIDFESGIEKLPQSIKKQYEGQLDEDSLIFLKCQTPCLDLLRLSMNSQPYLRLI